MPNAASYHVELAICVSSSKRCVYQGSLPHRLVSWTLHIISPHLTLDPRLARGSTGDYVAVGGVLCIRNDGSQAPLHRFIGFIEFRHPVFFPLDLKNLLIIIVQYIHMNPGETPEILTPSLFKQKERIPVFLCTFPGDAFDEPVTRCEKFAGRLTHDVHSSHSPAQFHRRTSVEVADPGPDSGAESKDLETPGQSLIDSYRHWTLRDYGYGERP